MARSTAQILRPSEVRANKPGLLVPSTEETPPDGCCSVRPDRAPWPDARQPDRGVVDVPVQCRGRLGQRLAPDASRPVRARRGRPGDDRGDPRLGHRSDHPQVPRPLVRCQRAGAGAGDRVLPAVRRRRARHPARPRRPQGLGPAAGRGRPAARAGRAAVDHAWPLGAALRRGLAHARRRSMARGSRRSGSSSSPPPCGRSGSASTCSSCTPPTAICCTSSCPRSATGGPTAMAAISSDGCASRSRCSGGPPGSARRPAARRARLGDRLGRRRLDGRGNGRLRRGR